MTRRVDDAASTPHDGLRPLLLPSNQPPDRFYRGGPLIARFRGSGAAGDHVPEDWVGSTTTLAGESDLGLTALADGRTLRDAVAESPLEWLGADHVRSFGNDTKLLVKLLHAGQRLPVHAHPDGEFARDRLARAHGKVEAWHILAGGEVHLGLRDDISTERLAELVETQQTVALLGLLHSRTVSRGDTVYVPAGMLHAIGEGVLLAELQEPEDLSILLEWSGFDLDGAALGHLGLGFDVALAAVDRSVSTEEDIDALIARDAWDPALPAQAAPYFRLERIRVDAGGAQDAVVVGRGFAVLIVVDGSVRADELDLPAGSTLLLPWSAGDVSLTGRGEVLVCRPPLP